MDFEIKPKPENQIHLVGEEWDQEREIRPKKEEYKDELDKNIEAYKSYVEKLPPGRDREICQRMLGDLEKQKGLATIDRLTGLYNRGTFDKELLKVIDGEEKARAARRDYDEENEKERKSAALVMFDIDNFKKINDTYGHLKGDEVLKDIAKLLQGGIRRGDLAVRYGGEELVIILNEIDEKEALVIADRFRHLINTQLSFISKEGAFQVSVSVGVSMLVEGDTSPMLIDRADHALYNSKKKEGKNCVSGNRIVDGKETIEKYINPQPALDKL